MNCPNCSVHIFDNHPNCIHCGFALTIMNKPHMNMNHTPGPWRVESHQNVSNIRNSAHESILVCRTQDAHLIAAAPEMYEALKDMQRVIRYLYLLEGLAYKVDKAIKKAEGKS